MKGDLNYDILISIIAGSLLFFLLCLFIVAFTLTYFRKKREHKMEKQRMKADFSKTLLQSQLEIKEQTLQHIGYELHDNLGQVASLIKINLNLIQLNDISKAQERVEVTKDLVKQMILDLKTLSLNLNSDRVVQLGILEGIKSEVKRLEKIDLFKVSYEHHGMTPQLDSNSTTILYRMSQEIINNIIKHSKADQIEISTEVSKNFFILIFKDNGVGFDLDEKVLSGGSGLLNLKSRARLIEANFQVESSQNGGTKIAIQIPQLSNAT